MKVLGVDNVFVLDALAYRPQQRPAWSGFLGATALNLVVAGDGHPTAGHRVGRDEREPSFIVDRAQVAE